jgi:hypothetical protein
LSLLPSVPALLLETFEGVFAASQQELRIRWQVAAYAHNTAAFKDPRRRAAARC